MNSFRIETKEEFFKILDCDEDTFTSAIKDKEKKPILNINYKKRLAVDIFTV